MKVRDETRTTYVLGGAVAVVAASLLFGGSAESAPQTSKKPNNCMAELRDAALAGNPNLSSPGRCNGAGPLHYAAWRLDGSVVTRLVAAGAEVEAVDNQGLTPLHYAAREGKLATLESLVVSGADPSRPDSVLRRTPLHYAVDGSMQAIGATYYGVAAPPSTDRFEVVEMLIKTGASINAEDIAGETPLHLAATAGDAAVMRLLLNAGANPNARNISGGDPPLFNAVLHGNEAAQRALEQHGADPQAVDSEGVSVVAKAREFALILNRFYLQSSIITKNEDLSAEERAERMAKQGASMKRRLEEQYEALKTRVR